MNLEKEIRPKEKMAIKSIKNKGLADVNKQLAEFVTKLEQFQKKMCQSKKNGYKIEKKIPCSLSV